VLQMGQTEVVMEEDDVGEMEEMWEEWQDGVLSAERPADRAMCRSGTEGRARRELCVCVNRFARVLQRVWL
jgi:hypothetical protein